MVNTDMKLSSLTFTFIEENIKIEFFLLSISLSFFHPRSGCEYLASAT